MKFKITPSQVSGFIYFALVVICLMMTAMYYTEKQAYVKLCDDSCTRLGGYTVSNGASCSCGGLYNTTHSINIKDL